MAKRKRARSSPGDDRVSRIAKMAMNLYSQAVPEWLHPHPFLYLAARQQGTTLTINGMDEDWFDNLAEDDADELDSDLLIVTAEGERAELYWADCRLLVWAKDKVATRKRLSEENKDD